VRISAIHHHAEERNEKRDTLYSNVSLNSFRYKNAKFENLVPDVSAFVADRLDSLDYKTMMKSEQHNKL